MPPEERADTLMEVWFGHRWGEDSHLANVWSAFAAAIRAAVLEEREACKQLASERVAEMVPVPCPDGIVGCEVLHAVRLERRRTPHEIVQAINDRTEEKRS